MRLLWLSCLLLPVSARAFYKSNGLTCQGASCPLTDLKKKGPWTPLTTDTDRALLELARQHPEKFTLFSGMLPMLQIAVAKQSADLDHGDAPEADRKRDLVELAGVIDSVPGGAKNYFQTTSFGSIGADTPLPAPKPVEKPKVEPVADQPGGETKITPNDEKLPPPPGAPTDAPEGSLITRSADGAWSVDPTGGGGTGGDSDSSAAGSAKGVERAGAMASGTIGGGAGKIAAAFGAGSSAKLAGGQLPEGAGGGMAGSFSGGRGNDGSGTGAAAGSGVSSQAGSSGGAPGGAGAAGTRSFAANSLNPTAQAAAAFGPLPHALERQPDYLNPARGGIAAEQFYQLKSDYRSAPELRETDFKHIGLSKEDTDFERTQSCDNVSGDCNKHSKKSYKRGEAVPPQELADIWKSVRSYLKSSPNTPNAAASAFGGKVGAGGIWGKLRDFLGGRRGGGPGGLPSARGGLAGLGVGAQAAEAAQAAPGAATAGGPAAAVPGGSGPTAPTPAAPPRSGWGLVIGLVVGAALVSTPLLRKYGR